MRFCGDNILAYNAKDLYPTLYDDVALELSGKKVDKNEKCVDKYEPLGYNNK